MSNFPFGFNPGPPDDDSGSGSGPGGPDQPVDPFSALMGGWRRHRRGLLRGSASCCPTRAARSTGTSPATWPGRRCRRPVTARWPPPSASRCSTRCASPSSGWTRPARSRPVRRRVKAWSRAEWVEATLPAWRELVDPIAGKVVDSMGTMLAGEGGPMAQLGAMPRAGGRAGRPAAADDAQHRRRRCSARRSARRSARSRWRWSARPTSGCRSRPAGHGGAAAGQRRPRSARASRSRPTRCGCTSRCARPPTSGCSRTCRGCARTCSTRSTAYARGITVDTARLEEAVGAHRPVRPRVDAAGADRRAVRARGHPGAEGRRWPGSRPRSRWSRAGSTRSSTRPPPRRCRPRPRCARPYAAAGPPAARPSRPSPSLVGLRAAAPPAARRGGAVAGGARRARPGRPGGGLGPPRPAARRRRPRRPDRLRHRRGLGPAGPVRPGRHAARAPAAREPDAAVDG